MTGDVSCAIIVPSCWKMAGLSQTTIREQPAGHEIFELEGIQRWHAVQSTWYEEATGYHILRRPFA